MDRRLVILALGMFALGTDSFVVAGVLPQIAGTYHVSIGVAGQLTTAYALSYALLSPVSAAAFAHVERKKVMLSGLAIFISANLATAVAPSYYLILVARAMAGVGASMYAPTATGTAASIVLPERRGFALSVVIAGLTLATALGSPIGTVIGGLGDWRWTMIFVATISVIAAAGIAAFLRDVPMPPAITLAQRLAPFADHRVGLTLLTTFLVQAGNFVIYTYFAVIFDRATHGRAVVLGALLVLWGTCGTILNLAVGRFIDGVGTRRILLAVLLVLIAVTQAISWASATLVTAIVVIAMHGAASWGQLAAQQHRLVTLAPTASSIVLGLNTSSTYLGVAAAGLLGAASLSIVGAHELGWAAMILYVGALIAAEVTHRSIVKHGIKASAAVASTSDGSRMQTALQRARQ